LIERTDSGKNPALRGVQQKADDVVSERGASQVLDQSVSSVDS
jgi:hypothetical protein